MPPDENAVSMIDDIRPVIGIRSLIHSMVVANVVAIETAAIGMEIQMIVGQTLTKARRRMKETKQKRDIRRQKENSHERRDKTSSVFLSMKQKKQ